MLTAMREGKKLEDSCSPIEKNGGLSLFSLLLGRDWSRGRGGYGRLPLRSGWHGHRSAGA